MTSNVFAYKVNSSPKTEKCPSTEKMNWTVVAPDFEFIDKER